MNIQMLINGELLQAISGEVMESVNTATEEMIGPMADETDVDLAVQSAARAFETWSKESIETREKVLRQFAEAIRGRKEEIAQLEARNSGNTIQRVRSDVEKDSLPASCS